MSQFTLAYRRTKILENYPIGYVSQSYSKFVAVHKHQVCQLLISGCNVPINVPTSTESDRYDRRIF